MDKTLCKRAQIQKNRSRLKVEVEKEPRQETKAKEGKKMQKSYRAPNPGDKRSWFIIDAKDQPIGRLAVVAANKLRAKDLATFDPSVDAGAFVIVINAAQVKLTGKKEEQKTYERYSGWRNGRKEFTAAQMRAKHPDRMIAEAVWGMLPKNNIARKMMTRLKVFAAAADEGMLKAQKPVEIKL